MVSYRSQSITFTADSTSGSRSITVELVGGNFVKFTDSKGHTRYSEDADFREFVDVLMNGEGSYGGSTITDN